MFACWLIALVGNVGWLEGVFRNEKCVELLIKAGSDLNAVDSGGRSALHYASNLPSLLAVTALLQSGASVNATDKKQGTPLHYASLSDHTGRYDTHKRIINSPLVIASIANRPRYSTAFEQINLSMTILVILSKIVL